MNRENNMKKITFIILLLLVFIIGCSKQELPQENNIGDIKPTIINELNLKSLDYHTNNLNIFESSNYYPGIRTKKGHEFYMNSYPSHYIVRTNAFDIAISFSESCKNVQNIDDYKNCLNEFKNILYSNGYVEDLSKKSDILMVHINKIPEFLSIPTTKNKNCPGGYPLGYKPKSYEIWKEFLKITTDYFKEIEIKTNTKIYYEFWNEPDLICNFDGETKEFLELYKNTMPILKQLHPTSKVGGTALNYFNGTLPKNKNKKQNLNFDLIDYTNKNDLPLDFITWHIFGNNIEEQAIQGMKEYKDFFKKNNYSELPIIISEWQTDFNTWETNVQASLGLRGYIGFYNANVSAQLSIWQDFGPKKYYDGFGILKFDSSPKPIFYIYDFFDKISRTSQGIYYKTKRIRSENYSIGEETTIISKENNNCYKLGVTSIPYSKEITSLKYIIDSGITLEELNQTYSNSKEILDDIKIGKSINKNWNNEFNNAKIIYNTIEDKTNKQETYQYIFNDSHEITSVSGVSIYDYNNPRIIKSINYKDNKIFFNLKAYEVVLVNICFKN